MIWTRKRPYEIYEIPTNLDRDTRLTDGPADGDPSSTRPLKEPLPPDILAPGQRCPSQWGAERHYPITLWTWNWGGDYEGGKEAEQGFKSFPLFIDPMSL